MTHTSAAAESGQVDSQISRRGYATGPRGYQADGYRLAQVGTDAACVHLGLRSECEWAVQRWSRRAARD